LFADISTSGFLILLSVHEGNLLTKPGLYCDKNVLHMTRQSWSENKAFNSTLLLQIIIMGWIFYPVNPSVRKQIV